MLLANTRLRSHKQQQIVPLDSRLRGHLCVTKARRVSYIAASMLFTDKIIALDVASVWAFPYKLILRRCEVPA